MNSQRITFVVNSRKEAFRIAWEQFCLAQIPEDHFVELRLSWCAYPPSAGFNPPKGLGGREGHELHLEPSTLMP